jgi:DNA-binding GntR family transcriptional regulator
MARAATSKFLETKAPQPSRSSAKSAYDMLLEAIESGQLMPGARLRESELAERFAVSRTPVREALKRLETQGLVTHEPHHGVIVATLDYSQIAELYHMREVLEGTAAQLAAIHATAIEIDLLQQMVVRDRQFLSDPHQLARSNRIFHQQLRNSARNRYLASLLENLRLSLALLAVTTLSSEGRAAQSIDEHELIVARIAARDSEGAEKAARAHIQAAFRARILLLQSTG